MKEKKSKKPLKKYARFSGIAFQMIAIICLGTYSGLKLDQKYPNKNQLFTIICSLFAVLISMYFVIKQVKNGF